MPNHLRVLPSSTTPTQDSVIGGTQWSQDRYRFSFSMDGNFGVNRIGWTMIVLWGVCCHRTIRVRIRHKAHYWQVGRNVIVCLLRTTVSSPTIVSIPGLKCTIFFWNISWGWTVLYIENSGQLDRQPNQDKSLCLSMLYMKMHPFPRVTRSSLKLWEALLSWTKVW